MAAKKKTPSKPGRKPPAGDKKQFLTQMDPDVLRRIKAEAALRERFAYDVLEEAARDWLAKNTTAGKRKRG